MVFTENFASCCSSILIIYRCNAIVWQVKSLSDASTLHIKNEPGTPTYDEDSMSSVDAQPVKVCLTAIAL